MKRANLAGRWIIVTGQAFAEVAYLMVVDPLPTRVAQNLAKLPIILAGEPCCSTLQRGLDQFLWLSI